MAFMTCFLGSIGTTPCPHTKKQDLLRYHSDKYRPSLAKRRRIIVCCTQEREHPEGKPSALDGELKDILNESMQKAPNDARSLQESDRRVMDGITEAGVTEIEGIADEVKGDLKDIQRTLEENATKLIEEETQMVLEKYDQKRQELLDNLKKDREIISVEIERITDLANSTKSKPGKEKGTTLREKAYFLTCSLFTVSALYFAWKGVTDADSAALKNAAIDAAVAAACTFVFSLKQLRD